MDRLLLSCNCRSCRSCRYRSPRVPARHRIPVGKISSGFILSRSGSPSRSSPPGLRGTGAIASGGSDALDRLAAMRGAVHHVVCDLVMPQMSGEALGKAIGARWPGTPILYVSGFPGADGVEGGMMPAGPPSSRSPSHPKSSPPASGRCSIRPKDSRTGPSHTRHPRSAGSRRSRPRSSRRPPSGRRDSRRRRSARRRATRWGGCRLPRTRSV